MVININQHYQTYITIIKFFKTYTSKKFKTNIDGFIFL